MGLTDLRTHGKSTVEDAIRTVPDRAKERLVASLKVLLGVGRAHWTELIDRAAASFESSFSFDESDVVSETGVSNVDARHMINGATFFAAMLSAHPEATPEQFVAALMSNQILEGENESEALELARIVTARRLALTEEFERSALRHTVLPSLRSVQTSVDIRLSVSQEITRAVPVVLLAIDTDAEGQILWCQLSKSELKSMIGKLQKTLEQVQAAESWIESRKSI